MNRTEQNNNDDDDEKEAAAQRTEYFHLNGKQSQYGSLHFQVTSNVCRTRIQLNAI